MNTAGIALGMAFVAAGIAAVIAAAWKARAGESALAYVLDETSAEPASFAGPAAPEAPLPSFYERVLRPLGRRASERVQSLFPSRHLDRLHRQLLHAGLAASIRAEEFATLQVVVAGVALFAGIALCAAAPGALRAKAFLAIVAVFCAVLGPPSWLARHVRSRTNAIERDLPDVLDLLTIAVEAGLGLEQAMEAACTDFECPMADELARTLQEMSLGLSRLQALENLKERSESGDLSSFVAVLIQADILGMPIGRVLRSQAEEMRARRRARAREKAAKLPVKILFPLLFFILPPLMIIVMGPAAASIARVFGH